MGNKNITKGKYAFDDLVNEVAPRFKESDGIVMESPILDE